MRGNLSKGPAGVSGWEASELGTHHEGLGGFEGAESARPPAARRASTGERPRCHVTREYVVYGFERRHQTRRSPQALLRLGEMLRRRDPLQEGRPDHVAGKAVVGPPARVRHLEDRLVKEVEVVEAGLDRGLVQVGAECVS